MPMMNDYEKKVDATPDGDPALLHDNVALLLRS
jgi:hypothetical protein